VRTSPKLLAAAGRNFLLTSSDDGVQSSSKAGCQFLGCEWHEAKLPKIVTSINDVAFGDDESIWLACREGLYHSKDQGETWHRLEKLPVVNLASVFHDAENRRMLVTAMNSTEVFSSQDDGESWQRRDSGWLLRTITEDAGRLLASTAFDGVVIEKPATESAEAGIAQRQTTKSVR